MRIGWCTRSRIAATDLTVLAGRAETRRVRTRLWLGAACGTFILFSAACGKPKFEPTAPQGKAAANGHALYKKYCALCHGRLGQGYAADNANALSHPDFLRTASDAFLLAAIEQGRPGTAMAAYAERFAGPLSPTQSQHIISFLRSLQKEPNLGLSQEPIRGNANHARSIYADECADCHGDSGQGKTALSLNNPVFLASANDSFLRYAIHKGRPGTPMPGFGERLSHNAINDLTALIRSWQRPVVGRPMGAAPSPTAQLVIHPEGQAPSFPPLRQGRFLPALAVKAAYDAGSKMVILDARPLSDWQISHLPGSISAPYYDIDKIVPKLPRDGTWILSYCGCPHAASGKVMDALRKRGFKNTAVIDEGFFVWKDRGYPVETGAGP